MQAKSKKQSAEAVSSANKPKDKQDIIACVIAICTVSYIWMNGLKSSSNLQRRLVAHVVLGELDALVQMKNVRKPLFTHVSLPDSLDSMEGIDKKS